MHLNTIVAKELTELQRYNLSDMTQVYRVTDILLQNPYKRLIDSLGNNSKIKRENCCSLSLNPITRCSHPLRGGFVELLLTFNVIIKRCSHPLWGGFESLDCPNLFLYIT